MGLKKILRSWSRLPQTRALRKAWARRRTFGLRIVASLRRFAFPCHAMVIRFTDAGTAKA
jgi:hypothetical protein